jgi:mono/diheme cytochrome c family protein
MTWTTRGRYVALGVALAGGLAYHAAALQGQQAPTPAQSIAAGSSVYGAKGCSGCHAINGIGGTVGPDLAHISAPSLASLVAALWNHLPRMADQLRTAGRSAPHFEPWEAANLMAFLFWAAAWTPPGDTARGRELYTSRHCILCHRVGNVGGVIGPALDGLRNVASPIDLASDLWNHAPTMAEEMRTRGVERPVLSGRDIDDLLAFFGVGSGALPVEGVYALGGNADEGHRLFRSKGCVRCHRAGGEGGTVGPNLTAVAPRAPTDFVAAMWNMSGPMLAAMRSAKIEIPRLSGAEMADLVAFLGSLQYSAGSGSVARGQRVVAAGGCNACHGKTAASLSRAPALGVRGAVIAALWNHIGRPPDSLRRFLRPLTAEQTADLMAYLESRERGP